MAAPMSKDTGEEVQERGEDLYDKLVKPNLRREDDGKFVAIDVESGDYEIDRDDFQATDRLLKRHEEAQIWLMRAGRSAAYHFGGRRTPKKRRCAVPISGPA
jgi:hypothetical protein